MKYRITIMIMMIIQFILLYYIRTVLLLLFKIIRTEVEHPVGPDSYYYYKMRKGKNKRTLKSLLKDSKNDMPDEEKINIASSLSLIKFSLMDVSFPLLETAAAPDCNEEAKPIGLITLSPGQSVCRSRKKRK